MTALEEKPVRELEFAAIDFESAGAQRGETDVPVQIGIAVMRGLEIERASFIREYLYTDHPIAWTAQRVHGISHDDLAGAPSLLSLWPRIKGALEGRLSVAHGAGTERRFLRAFPFHRFNWWVDTVTVARAAYPHLEAHNLGALISHLALDDELAGLCPDLTWHDALYDAVASLVVLKKVVSDHELQERSGFVLTSPDASEYYRKQSEQRRHRAL